MNRHINAFGGRRDVCETCYFCKQPIVGDIYSVIVKVSSRRDADPPYFMKRKHISFCSKSKCISEGKLIEELEELTI